jgi:hypothetical protein
MDNRSSIAHMIFLQFTDLSKLACAVLLALLKACNTLYETIRR